MIGVFNLRLITMKKYLLITILSLFVTLLSAQFGGFGGGGGPKIKGKISGSVVDSLTGQPVGFATVSLRRSGKEKIINGSLSEDDGDFSFTDISPGKYDIEVSFLGYTAKFIRDIETTKKKPDYNIGAIQLGSTDYLLDEVQITEKRALFENKIDRIVFNAEDDSSVAGGDATDVLRKVPNLSVDPEGNVSIRGSQNVRILINGKPSGMFSSNVADALKLFPADQIKRVEVITSPGAKYDGEGSAGIINIVTQKGSVEGVAGSFNGAVGNRQSNVSGNLNVGKGRFGSTISGSVFYSHPVDGTFELNRVTTVGGVETTLNQSGLQNTSRLGFNSTASAFYDFNAYNALNTSFTLRGFGFDTDGNFEGTQRDATGATLFSFNNANVGDNLFSGFDWNTDYTKKFEEDEGRELVIAYQLSKGDQDTENDIVSTGSFAEFDRIQNIFNDGDNWENTLQVDYTHPLPKSFKLETGAKTVIRDITSDSKFSDIVDGEAVLDANQSNVFRYDQNVFAGYGQLSYTIGKLNFITGLRYERTEIGGAFDDNSGFNFTNSYDNWLPNFTISRPLKNFRNLKISYNRRIERPSLRNVNPFFNNSNITNVQVGNPLLDPEITDQIELSYNTRVAGFNIFGSTYYRRSDDIIEDILEISNITTSSGEVVELSVATFDNVGTNNSFGINLFVNKTINKLNIRFGGDFFTYDGSGIINGEVLSNRDVQYQFFGSGEYSFSGTVKADFFSFSRSEQPTLQGNTPAFSIVGVGLRKDLGPWSIGVRVINPIRENLSFNTVQETPSFSQVSGFTTPFRSFGVNVRYKFGKVDFRERKSKIKNTDQGSGEGQGGQGGGGQGGGIGN